MLKVLNEINHTLKLQLDLYNLSVKRDGESNDSLVDKSHKNTFILLKDHIKHIEEQLRLVSYAQDVECIYRSCDKLEWRFGVCDNDPNAPESVLYNFSLMHVNIGNISENAFKLNNLMIETNAQPDFVCVSDTRLRNGDEPESLEGLQDYSFEGMGMSSGMLVGGAGIYIRKDINHRRRQELERTVPFIENRCENVFVEIKSDKRDDGTKVIGVLYKAEEVEYDNFISWLTQVIGTVLADDNSTLYITGSFKVDILSHPRRVDFIESLKSLGCR